MSIGRRPPLFFSLRWRLSAAIGGVAALCVALCVMVAVIFLRQALTDRAAAELRRTLDGVSGYMSIQGNDLLGAAELVAADPTVVAATKKGDGAALRVHLTLFYNDLGANVLDVIDARGRVVTHMEDAADPQAYSGVGRTWPSVRAALAGREVQAFDTDLPGREATSGYALRATVPLHDGPRIIGAVVVGRQLDDIYAIRIGNAFNATVNLIAGTQRAGTTLVDSGGPALAPAAILKRIASDQTTIDRVDLGGRAALSGLAPLPAADGPPVAAVEVIYPLDPLYNVITQLSFLLLALCAGVVLVGTALALGLSRRLTARLLALESAAARVAMLSQPGLEEGEGAPLGDLHDALTVRGDDEVASLARSFEAMMGALDERMAAAQARVRELTGLAEIARLLTAASSLRETLDELSAHVCRLVGGAAAAIVLYGEGTAPNVHGGSGLPKGYAQAINAAMAGADGGGFLTAPEAALRDDQVAWRRVTDLPDSHATIRAYARSAGWGGALAVPLRLQGRPIGALVCYTVAHTPPSSMDLSLLMTIAGQVAVVVENARLQERARDLAAVTERQRLARELHDSVSQALFGIALGTRTARTLLDHDPARAADPLDYVLTLAEAGLVEMRALIFELRPEALETEGLVAALEKQVDFMRARHGIITHLVAETEPAVPFAAKEALYRIAREALHNAVKHAHARNVDVRLAVGATGRLTLEVCDDGVGFDPAGVFPGHLGLHTMRERAAQLEGTLELRSAPGSGTRVRVEMP